VHIRRHAAVFLVLYDYVKTRIFRWRKAFSEAVRCLAKSRQRVALRLKQFGIFDA